MTEIVPLPARSVALSLLLGSHPDRMSPAMLIRAGEHLGIPSSTMRVALTRAVAAGDLRRLDGDYVLGERLVRRQRHQDEGVEDAERPWDGSWEMTVVVVSGRPGPERAALRDLLTGHRLAELREGVWTRPANLRRPQQYADDPVLRVFRAEPDDPARLAATLWDLDTWVRDGRALLERLDATTDPAPRLAVAAALVRHLSADPLLPQDLLPRDWPAAELRSRYTAYQAELRELAADRTG
ncbi:MAG: PaaX domain-containing protein, C- domain protein [Nocardioidaceae bacterium]|nr:PaaX domain-containing protein, C- domain protein [Nocardioidaceae bacterium]MCL2614206.1 PaaX domain-containing protein, C- domain protein [Nocardioidaceae bacterium]